MIRYVVAGIAMASSLTACGGPPADGGTYQSPLALRDAAIKAGLDCPAWDRKSPTFGSCDADGGTLIHVYPNNEEDPEQVAQRIVDELASVGVMTSYLVGANWFITGFDAAELQDKLGGKVITKAK